MKTAASTSNICNLGAVLPLFVFICACWAFNQNVRDCSMHDRFVIEPADVYRQIGGMESKIECMLTCIRELMCSGAYYENKTTSCNLYSGTKLFRRGLEGNFVIFYVDRLRVTLAPLEPPFDLDEANNACGLLRAQLMDYVELLTAAYIGVSTCTCGRYTDGAMSIQSSSDKNCRYSADGLMATCTNPKHAYCKL